PFPTRRSSDLLLTGVQRSSHLQRAGVRTGADTTALGQDQTVELGHVVPDGHDFRPVDPVQHLHHVGFVARVPLAGTVAYLQGEAYDLEPRVADVSLGRHPRQRVFAVGLGRVVGFEVYGYGCEHASPWCSVGVGWASGSSSRMPCRMASVMASTTRTPPSYPGSWLWRYLPFLTRLITKRSTPANRAICPSL